MSEQQKPTVEDIERAMRDAEGGAIEIMPDGQVRAVPPLRRPDLVASVETMRAGARVTIRETWTGLDGSDCALVLDGYLLACAAFLELLGGPTKAPPVPLPLSVVNEEPGS